MLSWRLTPQVQRPHLDLRAFSLYEHIVDDLSAKRWSYFARSFADTQSENGILVTPIMHLEALIKSLITYVDAEYSCSDPIFIMRQSLPKLQTSHNVRPDIYRAHALSAGLSLCVRG